MKANELRIGNYLSQSLIGSGWSQGRINYTKDLSLVEDAPSKFEGIPLTIDWLNNFGFSWSIYHQSFHKDGFEFDLNCNHDGLMSLSTFKRKLIIADKIKYVHQLQNLYYALSGEELILQS